MEKQIIKIETCLKSKILDIVGREWKDVSVVLFESKGITVYLKEYGNKKFISYESLNK